MRATPAPASNKEAALSFLRLVVANRVRDAYAAHVAPDFRHHNVHFPGDRASLLRGMEENAREAPSKRLEVQHALEEGDLVAVHSRLEMAPGGPVVAVVHLLRFEGGKVAELWDVGAPVPAGSPNRNGPF